MSWYTSWSYHITKGRRERDKCRGRNEKQMAQMDQNQWAHQRYGYCIYWITTSTKWRRVWKEKKAKGLGFKQNQGSDAS